jgi:hypothetical protein
MEPLGRLPSRPFHGRSNARETPKRPHQRARRKAYLQYRYRDTLKAIDFNGPVHSFAKSQDGFWQRENGNWVTTLIHIIRG